MPFTLTRTLPILQRTPKLLNIWLQGLEDCWTKCNYGPDTFNPYDVVGHLIHGEQTDWMVRVRIILEHGEAEAFPPFDRYAMYIASQGKSMEQLLAEFATLREQNLEGLQKLHLTEEQLDRRGTHAALGRVTLRQLLATWVVHDLNHLHQIAKAMAYQYREEVGPWQQYLSILPAS
ncbi:MAG TPA: DinB family protein [Gemmatales bacterium]|nr:DinB family protein [Gemmatales bacterium]